MLRIARNLKTFFALKQRLRLPFKVKKTCKNAGYHVLLGRWGRMPFFLLLFFLLLHWGPPGEPPSRVLAAARRISKRRLRPSCKARKTCKNAGCHMLLGRLRLSCNARKTCKNAGCHMLLGLLRLSCKARKTRKNAGCHVFGPLETIPGPLPKKVCLIRKRRKIVLNTWFGVHSSNEKA